MERLVADVYRARYWSPLAEWLEGRVLEKVFNAGVNVGPGAAVRLLQKALIGLGARISADGLTGPRTAEAARAAAEPALLRAYVREQEAYYRDIARRKPSQAKFLKGWLRRAAWVPPEGG
jgi:lysozyme family protein